MTQKIINSVKYLLIFCVVLFSVIACEKDFENIGVNIVDNNLFDTNFEDFEVIAYSKDVDSSRVDFVPGMLYNLGILDDDDFGILRSSFVTQLGFSTDLENLRTRQDVVIDTVIIDIPYFSTSNEDNSDGTPNFSLDSVFGDISKEYTLRINRLGTFLNTLDPNDPTQNKEYYSDEDYEERDELNSVNFIPEASDTMLLVTRPFFFENDSITIDTDTIKADDVSPSIKLPLDKNMIKTIFRDEATSSNFASTETFNNYFRGLIISPEGDLGSSMALAMADATFNIYYTYVVLTDEDGTDLNGNNTTDDLDVPVYTKATLSLPFAGIRANTYERNYAGSTIENFILSPDKELGTEKLFVQGSAGSIAEFELFRGIDLEELKARGWLINAAFLDVYVDESTTNVPDRLYLYNAEENSIVIDVISEASVTGIGGFLERDEETNTPIRYRFSITDYISQVLGSDFNARTLASKFAIKTYHSSDAPQNFVDTLVRNFSWINKGVVLKGNKIDELDEENFEKRLKLRIYYTEVP